MKIKQENIFRLSVLVLVGLWFSAASAFGFDPLRDYSRVDLNKLNKNPKTYKNTDVKFRVYFHQIEDMWSPFFSPFLPSDFVAFSAWDHEKNIWKKKDMLDDFPFLYMKNGSDEINKILTANKYDFLELKGTVVSAFKSKPWVEVRHVKVLQRKRYTNNQLSKFMLASEASANGHPTVATQYYEEGLNERSLPKHDRAEVHKQLAINYFKASDFDNAIQSVNRYREYATEEDPTLQSLLEEAQKLQKMSPEERNAYEKKRWKRKSGEQTGYVSPEINSEREDPVRLKKKYRTLLSRYEQILNENQSLKSTKKELRKQNRNLVRNLKKSKKGIQELKRKNKELERKLTNAYQKNARLLARLHEKNRKKKSRPSKRDKSSSKQETMQVRNDDRDTSSIKKAVKESGNLRNKKLLSRIRILKRRNRSLRSQMTSLSNHNRAAQEEIDRLRNQVNLETSSAQGADRSVNEQNKIESSTSDQETQTTDNTQG